MPNPIDLIDRFVREWIVIRSAPISFIICIVIVGIFIWFVFEAMYRTTIRNKDSRIEVLREKLRIFDEGISARIEIDKHETTSEKSPYEKEALAIKNGSPTVHQAFLELTNAGSVKIAWNPMKEPWEWEGVHNPTKDDEREMEALRYLWNKGYIASWTDSGVGDHILTSSDYADKVREAYDRLLQTP